MHMFGKKSKIKLAQTIAELSSSTSEEFIKYLENDEEIYSKCISDNPIRVTTTLFMIDLYRDLLNSKYNADDVFKVIYTTIFSMSPNKEVGNKMFEGFLTNSKQTRDIVEYYKQQPDFDIAQVLTDVYFKYIIDDEDYFMEELENSIRKQSSYKKIYNKINGIGKNSIILTEKYNMRLK